MLEKLRQEAVHLDARSGILAGILSARFSPAFLARVLLFLAAAAILHLPCFI